MKKLLLILLFVGLSVSVASSQITIDKKSKSELTAMIQEAGFAGELSSQLQTIRSQPGQAAVVKQVGAHNRAVIKQEGTNLFTYLRQAGNHLEAELTLVGTNNSTIIKQVGNRLSTKITLIGRNNNLKMLQSGTKLSSKIILKHAVGLDAVMLQTNHRFLYAQSGGSGVPLMIRTTRAVPRITVTNR